MTCLKLASSEPVAVLALLTLQKPLTPQALHELEHAVAETLARLEPEHASSRHEAAETEYASWNAHLPSAVRRLAAGRTGRATSSPS